MARLEEPKPEVSGAEERSSKGLEGWGYVERG